MYLVLIQHFLFFNQAIIIEIWRTLTKPEKTISDLISTALAILLLILLWITMVRTTLQLLKLPLLPLRIFLWVLKMSYRRR
ncbi:TPA_asm: P overlapped [Rose alphacytorhabdovirus 1]|nr:TPA_asm: P overlapped [Rose alphacytorhabdovirus 1]